MVAPTARRLLLIALATFTCACERTATPTFVVRDSAGVRIVESTVPIWAPGAEWAVDPAPMLSIGAVDGPPEISFSRIVGVHRTADGGLAVIDDESGQIRFFDAAGRFRRSFGGPGEGPGEFQRMRASGSLRDSVWAYDAGLNRLTFVDPASAGFRVAPVEAQFLTLGSAGAFPDGSLLLASDLTFTNALASPQPAGMRRYGAAYVRIAPSGETIDTLLVADGAERFLQPLGGGFQVMIPLLGRSASHVLRGELLLYGDQSSYEIRVYDVDGTLVEIVRRPGIDLSVSGDAIRAALEERLSTVAPEAREGARAANQLMPSPRGRPAYGRFLADAAGYLWVQDFAVLGDAPTWSVFAEDGSWLGEVEMPDRFRPEQIFEDEVVGVWRDELDVEYVRVHGLRR